MDASTTNGEEEGLDSKPGVTHCRGRNEAKLSKTNGGFTQLRTNEKSIASEEDKASEKEPGAYSVSEEVSFVLNLEDTFAQRCRHRRVSRYMASLANVDDSLQLRKVLPAQIRSLQSRKGIYAHRRSSDNDEVVDTSVPTTKDLEKNALSSSHDRGNKLTEAVDWKRRALMQSSGSSDDNSEHIASCTLAAGDDTLYESDALTNISTISLARAIECKSLQVAQPLTNVVASERPCKEKKKSRTVLSTFINAVREVKFSKYKEAKRCPGCGVKTYRNACGLLRVAITNE